MICSFIIFSNVVPTHQDHFATTPPLPISPLPSFSQLKWHQREIIFFHHFGVNTFTDSEWGTGKENPKIFNPKGLNTAQWIDVAIQTGVSLSILTAKHHDGFCLWPSKYTDHSIIGSPLHNGHGDVVKEFTDSAKDRGVDVGLYLSPWDRHDRRYGNEIAYNEYYLGQLQELLNKYGNVHEIWFDGAKGTNAPNMSYLFNDWFQMVEELQSSINIFSDAGPGVRWVGNEKGFAGTTCWSTINRTALSIGNASIVDYLSTGDPKGTDWVPAESSSVRGGKGSGFGPESVLDNDHLWTYWAPNDRGNKDHWIEFTTTGEELKFNVVRIQEAIGLGQRIWKHEIHVDGKRVATGTTVGYKKLHRLKDGVVTGRSVRIRVIGSRGIPLISSVGLHYDPFWRPMAR
uniref:alpha-L-fucosidase n=1 Tax=Tanacetum cinerariifolium TaxID=118510 RepID=A0A6L2JKA0_TANCI|nr:alpha-L-fucosidase 1-like [Tanacetum cinerariifolium]